MLVGVWWQLCCWNAAAAATTHLCPASSPFSMSLSEKDTRGAAILHAERCPSQWSLVGAMGAVMVLTRVSGRRRRESKASGRVVNLIRGPAEAAENQRLHSQQQAESERTARAAESSLTHTPVSSSSSSGEDGPRPQSFAARFYFEPSTRSPPVVRTKTSVLSDSPDLPNVTGCTTPRAA